MLEKNTEYIIMQLSFLFIHKSHFCVSTIFSLFIYTIEIIGRKSI